jgi:hypothetical protein
MIKTINPLYTEAWVLEKERVSTRSVCGCAPVEKEWRGERAPSLDTVQQDESIVKLLDCHMINRTMIQAFVATNYSIPNRFNIGS